MNKMLTFISPLSKYYVITLTPCVLIFAILSIVNFDFVNILFFLVSYVWHFALVTPGLKEKVITARYKYSFLNVIMKVNYYLQMFIKIERISFTPSVVRAISPLLFTGFLLLVGGSGNILFSLLGSLLFEIIYLSTKKYYQNAISNFQDVKETQKDQLPEEN